MKRTKMSRWSRWMRLAPTFAATAGLLAIPHVASHAAATPHHASGSNSVTIGFLEKWPEPQYAPYFQKVVADYQRTHPNVTVAMQAVGDQPYKDKIRVLTAAGALPDIYFSWAGDFTKKFVRAGLAANLTDAFYKSSWHTTVGASSAKAYTYDGKLYGIPMDLDAKFFVYNTAIFKQYHLTPPKTLANLLGACGVLKQHGVQPIAFGNQYGWPAIHYLTTLNGAYVPQATLQRDYTPTTGRFTDPGYLRALTTFKQLSDRCLTPQANGINHNAAQAQVLAGRAAMQYVESQEFFAFTKAGGAPASIANTWNFFKFPAIPGAAGNQTYLTGAPDGFLVSSHTKHMAQVIDFLKFFTDKANGQLMVKMLGWGSPVIGSSTEANTFPQLRQANDLINTAKGMNIWLDTVTNATVAQAYLAGTEGLLDGSRTPQQVMQSIQAAAKTLHT